MARTTHILQPNDLFLVIDIRVLGIDDIVVIFLCRGCACALLSTRLRASLAGPRSALCACCLICSRAELVKRLLELFGCLLDGFRVAALQRFLEVVDGFLDSIDFRLVGLVAEVFDRLL